MVLTLTSQADIKELGGISGSGTDDVITTIAAGVNEALEGYFGRPLEDTGSDVTEYYDGSGTDRLQLRRFPVHTVTSVNVDIDRDFASATLVPAADYVIYKETGILRFLPVANVGIKTIPNFARGMLNVEVVYRGGWTASSPHSTAVPNNLKLAASMWAIDIFNKRRDLGMFSVTRGAATEMFSLKEMPMEVRGLLSRYQSGALELGGYST